MEDLKLTDYWKHYPSQDQWENANYHGSYAVCLMLSLIALCPPSWDQLVQENKQNSN